jgi:hypothetical protein
MSICKAMLESSGKPRGGTGTYGVPSPDGRHLAMQKMTVEGNLWMMENF